VSTDTPQPVANGLVTVAHERGVVVLTGAVEVLHMSPDSAREVAAALADHADAAEEPDPAEVSALSKLLNDFGVGLAYKAPEDIALYLLRNGVRLEAAG
jgi:hypothetical protein